MAGSSEHSNDFELHIIREFSWEAQEVLSSSD
jgi:hypothetical protein